MSYFDLPTESSRLPPGHLGLFRVQLEKRVDLLLAVGKGFAVRFVRWNSRVYASLKTASGADAVADDDFDDDNDNFKTWLDVRFFPYRASLPRFNTALTPYIMIAVSKHEKN